MMYNLQDAIWILHRYCSGRSNTSRDVVEQGIGAVGEAMRSLLDGFLSCG